MRTKWFVVFYKFNLKGELTEYLGSDGVYILDGRYSLPNMKEIAHDVALKRAAKGYSIHVGTFTRNRQLTPIERIS